LKVKTPLASAHRGNPLQKIQNRRRCAKVGLAVGAGGSRNMSYRALSAQSVIDFDAIAFANQVA
jgi:hypothetical protein